jgi:glutamate-5-semialdehyde dehydrogenase
MITELCKSAKTASYKLASYKTEEKNAILSAVASALENAEKLAVLREANQKDIALALQNGKDATFVDRLTLTEARIAGMVEGVRQIIALPDPVGEVVEERTLANGLEIKRLRAPLGVIGIIYEARPNVTVDAAALTIKSGNAVILRGSKDAMNSNRCLYEIMKEEIEKLGLDGNCVCFVDDPAREATKELLKQDKYVDVIIPRGGEGLKHFVLDNATMPVIASAGGNCHVYVEKSADLSKAVDVIINAKVQRPSVCNAAEHHMLDTAIVEDFAPVIAKELKSKGVELVVDEFVSKYVDAPVMTESDFETEFLTYKMSICAVENVTEAVEIINKFGTKHSEAILSSCPDKLDFFSKNVDAAAVYLNASTRFTDGFEFGLGAEMGISTQKLHVRGPIALRELTSVKYVISGNYTVRS